MTPRDTDRYRELYRGRSAVEREVGRLSTIGRLPLCGFADWIGSGSMPT